MQVTVPRPRRGVATGLSTFLRQVPAQGKLGGPGAAARVRRHAGGHGQPPRATRYDGLAAPRLRAAHHARRRPSTGAGLLPPMD